MIKTTERNVNNTLERMCAIRRREGQAGEKKETTYPAERSIWSMVWKVTLLLHSLLSACVPTECGNLIGGPVIL